jgi:hypothetical protein
MASVRKGRSVDCVHVRFDGLGGGMEDMRWLVAHELGSEALIARRPVVGVVV